jgi:Uma2 family endonuclease
MMAIQTVQVQRRLFTVEEFEQMIRAGVLHEDDRLELIEGEIIEMSPIGSAHLAHVNRLNHLFVQRAGTLAQVSVQNPIHLPRSEPQPDVALLRPRPDYYADALPQPADVMLLIEVADTTVDYDRSVKIPLYGRNEIVESWLIDLMANVIEVYRGPAATGYRIKQTYGPGDPISLAALPSLSVAAEEILR